MSAMCGMTCLISYSSVKLVSCSVGFHSKFFVALNFRFHIIQKIEILRNIELNQVTLLTLCNNRYPSDGLSCNIYLKCICKYLFAYNEV